MKRITCKRRFMSILLPGMIAVYALLLGACYVPLTRDDGALALDIQMSRNSAGGDTKVLAGLLINAEYEEALKDITQLLAVLNFDGLTPFIEKEIEEKATELLLDLALSGTIKFGGNPFFTIEVPYNTSANTAEFNISGVPSKRDYFLYMGGFEDKEQVKQYFGLMEEDTEFDADLIPFSNLFYVEGTDSGETVTVVLSVSGVGVPLFGGFIINKGAKYNGPGWYYLEFWDSLTHATIIAPAGQPFRVETGKKSPVEVYLVNK